MASHNRQVGLGELPRSTIGRERRQRRRSQPSSVGPVHVPATSLPRQGIPPYATKAYSGRGKASGAVRPRPLRPGRGPPAPGSGEQHAVAASFCSPRIRSDGSARCASKLTVLSFASGYEPSTSSAGRPRVSRGGATPLGRGLRTRVDALLSALDPAWTSPNPTTHAYRV